MIADRVVLFVSDVAPTPRRDFVKEYSGLFPPIIEEIHFFFPTSAVGGGFKGYARDIMDVVETLTKERFNISPVFFIMDAFADDWEFDREFFDSIF